MNIIFVYGTLRSGFHNHSLLYNSKLIGKGKTKDKYALYSFGVPFLVNEPVTQVIGEVYSVSDKTLKHIDSLEMHPNWYKRKLISIMVNNQEYIAWAYFNVKQGNLIKSGDYEKR